MNKFLEKGSFYGVSWIRRTDFHVLTVGMETYTSDERFEALHLQKSNDWTLQIKYTQLRDSGTYECQVSSDPKISFFVNLTIVGKLHCLLFCMHFEN
ncbi:hypothetical protein CDAR_97291 [Caerostris darwini]|uniref:Ig-like domain-containing protein n=1 Tax=Caerostris darwini TaxID=1538125 RepID=A0AAV4QKY1_9ARAC|nr:hypothetical protein CDAR_97291 [Caerostris darwini]